MKALLIGHAAARGLARTGPRPDRLLPRVQATAEIAAHAVKAIQAGAVPAVADESVEGIVSVLSTHPPDATVALVGHEPVLGALLARMLGSSQAARLAFKKGGAALVDLPNGPSTPGRLIWFLDPRVLRTLAAPGPGTAPASRPASRRRAPRRRKTARGSTRP